MTDTTQSPAAAVSSAEAAVKSTVAADVSAAKATVTADVAKVESTLSTYLKLAAHYLVGAAIGAAVTYAKLKL
jgi:hypothetical protein